MSSNYKAICITHNPALLLDWTEYRTAEDAIEAVIHREGHLEQHPHCDLLISRWSGGPVEIGCPAPGMHHGYHPHSTEWVDIDWLRLLYAAADNPSELEIKALKAFRTCWTPERIRPLRGLLRLDGE